MEIANGGHFWLKPAAASIDSLWVINCLKSCHVLSSAISRGIEQHHILL